MISKATDLTDAELHTRYGYNEAQIQMLRREAPGEQLNVSRPAHEMTDRVPAKTQTTKTKRVRRKKPQQCQAAKPSPDNAETETLQPEAVRALLDQQETKATTIHPGIRRIFAGERGGGDLAIVLSNLVMFWFSKDKNGKIRASAAVKGDTRMWVSMPIWRWAEIHGLAESSMRKVLSKLQAQHLIEMHTVRGKHGVWVAICPDEITARISAAVEDA